MERYIDAEILKNKILDDMVKAEREGKDLNGYTDSLFHLKTTPAADVVPKSEVAREIFAKIDKTLDETRRKYRDQLDAYGVIYINYARSIIAELKKKYTEDQTNG